MRTDALSALGQSLRKGESSVMLDLATVTLADFRPTLQQVYLLRLATGEIPLTLNAVEPRGPSHPQRAQPFVLTFQGRADLHLPQGIYRLHHDQLGPLEIFLVQVASQADGSYFEATFN